MAYDAGDLFRWASELEQQGDDDGATRAWELCFTSGGQPWADRAALRLALVALRGGDPERAVRLYRGLIAASEDDESLVGAVFNLAALHQETGRIAEAIDGYRAAADSTHAELAAKAGVNLAYLLFFERHDRDGATAVLEEVIASGHPVQAPLAQRNLDAMRATGPDAGWVTDEFVDVARGIDTVTGERADLRYRIVGQPDDRDRRLGRLVPLVVDPARLPSSAALISEHALPGLALVVAEYDPPKVEFLSAQGVAEVGGTDRALQVAFGNLWGMPSPAVETVRAVAGRFSTDVWMLETTDPCAPSRYFQTEALLPLVGRTAAPSHGFFVAVPTWHVLFVYPLISSDTTTNALAVAAYLAQAASGHFHGEPEHSRVSCDVYYVSTDQESQAVARLTDGGTRIATGGLMEELLGPDGLVNDTA